LSLAVVVTVAVVVIIVNLHRPSSSLLVQPADDGIRISDKAVFEDN